MYHASSLQITALRWREKYSVNRSLMFYLAFFNSPKQNQETILSPKDLAKSCTTSLHQDFVLVLPFCHFLYDNLSDLVNHEQLLVYQKIHHILNPKVLIREVMGTESLLSFEGLRKLVCFFANQYHDFFCYFLKQNTVIPLCSDPTMSAGY